MLDVNRLPLEGQGGLIEMLRTLVDPRKARGVRHPLVTVVAISICAALSGARSFKAIAEWAKDLRRETLLGLGSRRWHPPSEPTIFSISMLWFRNKIAILRVSGGFDPSGGRLWLTQRFLSEGRVDTLPASCEKRQLIPLITFPEG
jgi:hypothetical protein